MVLSAMASLSACDPTAATSPPSSPPPVTVTVIHPEKSIVQDALDYTGRIEPSQRVEVRSRVSGYLQAIQFRDGQHVKAGTPLFVIDPRPFLATRDRAQASLAQATARQRLAATQLERIRRMQRSGAASTEELDRALGELESAEAAMLLAQADLRSAELELSFTTIRAPISGLVSDRRVDVGNYLVGGTTQGGILTTIVSQSPVRAIVDLSEADFQRLRQGGSLPKQVELRWDGADDKRLAAVDFIDNEISARSGTIRLRASLPNADHAVLPGNFARISIPLGSSQERLLVPDAAILSDQTRKLVMVVDAEGKVAARPLQLGGLLGKRHVVLSGLAADDKVIVSGIQRVRPGDQVQVAWQEKGTEKEAGKP